MSTQCDICGRQEAEQGDVGLCSLFLNALSKETGLYPDLSFSRTYVNVTVYGGPLLAVCVRPVGALGGVFGMVMSLR